MDVQASLTVFFEDPFWVGVYERRAAGRLEAARIVFGAEPKDYQVLEIFLNGWHRLCFSPPVPETAGAGIRKNPKRMQREIQARLSHPGASTKAQIALQKQREQTAAARKTQSRARRETEVERKFSLRTQKRREKHRGH